MNITKQTKSDFWKTHIALAAKRGSSAQAYCRENDLDPLQFYYWRGKRKKQVLVSTHQALARVFVPVSVEPARLPVEDVRSLPDAEWVGRFAVQIIRGLSR